jgi:transposase
MNLVYERCAGLDVHKRNVVVCANIPDAQGQRRKERQMFSTMTPDLLRLRQWLKDLEVTHVAMEKVRQATGNRSLTCWKGIWRYWWSMLST